MKKVLTILALIIFAYLGSGIVSAYLLEAEAEKYMQLALADIAKPWDEAKLTKRASSWMLEKAKLTPQKIASMSAQDLGSFIKFNQEPDCILQQGYDTYSTIKHTYAVCINNAQFEKLSVNLKVRLIKENGHWKINDFISIN